ncbi:serine/threonine kinase [Mycobacterium phage JustHall]|nr:serine/threonine kinase [Mycobacterium phage JustHall]
MTTFHEAVKLITEAKIYTDLFPDVDVIGHVYRSLASAVHPDRVPHGQHAKGTRAFHRLNEFKVTAERMRDEGRYGEPEILASIASRNGTHMVTAPRGEDEMAVYFQAQSVTKSRSHMFTSMVKVAKSAKDNDLMVQEAKALKTLHTPSEDAGAYALTRHFPQLMDTFLHSEGRRRANVTPYFEHYRSLATLKEMFCAGLDPKHAVWIFRRLLMALGYSHDRGLVHGAITPDNILIEPQNHAVVLIDWCYSVVIDSESKTHVKAVVPMYRDFYPAEVLAKGPATPATDLYMAVFLIRWLMGTRIILPFRAFLNGVTLESPRSRPQNAWALLKEFDELLERIGSPYHPRKFAELVLPQV